MEVDILTAVSQDETWVYVPATGARGREMFEDPTVLLTEMFPDGAGERFEYRIRRLLRLHTIGDPVAGPQQRWHYTSQTDVPVETDDEFNRWFDEEHLPGLAAVPGTVRASRYRTDGSPRYLAGYDLSRAEVQGGGAWSAAVSTPWRDRIHREFVGPRRLMFERLLDDRGTGGSGGSGA